MQQQLQQPEEGSLPESSWEQLLEAEAHGGAGRILATPQGQGQQAEELGFKGLGLSR